MEPNQRSKHLSPKTIWIIAGIAIIVFALAGVGYWQYSKQKQAARDKAALEQQLADAKKASDKAKADSEAAKTVTDETTPTGNDYMAGWKTYTNDEYAYTFKYPANTTVEEADNGDSTTLTGDISEKGWPMIIVTHRDNDYFNLPSGTDLLTHLKDKFAFISSSFPDSPNINITGPSGNIPGYKVVIPRSPQAYGSWNIYFEKDSKIFEIQMLDPDTTEAQTLYNNWLTAFKME